MPRQADYRATDHITTGDDLYTRPAFSLSNRLRRLIWNITWLLFYRLSPRPFHAWRALILKAFGAKLGPDCHFYPASKVWAPWNLVCADHVAAGDGVEIYNPSPIQIDSHVILSQDSYLCGATHDYNDPAFPLLAFRMHIAQYAWICARASVAPGVHVAEGAVLGLGSIATRDLKPWTVYSGNPAVAIRERTPHHTLGNRRLSMISALILTKNEEQDLPACLASIAWCDDIHVFDSNSTDRTATIARDFGATVTTRAFDSYAAQRNAAMLLPFRHPWVLVLDADERPTPALSAEIQLAVAAAPATVSGFRIRRRDFLWGTWLKHAQMSPFYVRLLRAGKVHYIREVNEIAEVDGDILELHAPLDHLAFSKGLAHWVAKHNIYSSREAELLASGAALHGASLRQALFHRNFHDRRIAQKAIFYELPARPLIKWTYMMFVRGAILDGHAGIMYATLQSIYEYLIEIKRREILRRRANQPF